MYYLCTTFVLLMNDKRIAISNPDKGKQSAMSVTD